MRNSILKRTHRQNKYFELKNSWGCRPNSNYLFKLAHAESIGMHIASLMQGHTDTNRLCNYFFLSFAHSELHQTILLFIPSHIVCFLLEDRNTIRGY